VLHAEGEVACDFEEVEDLLVDDFGLEAAPVSALTADDEEAEDFAAPLLALAGGT